ncbi:MAG: EAL domain-containing protein [Marinobacter sp.]|nr:EAL domain-containing protein [Marinobacter sp.]
MIALGGGLLMLVALPFTHAPYLAWVLGPAGALLLGLGGWLLGRNQHLRTRDKLDQYKTRVAESEEQIRALNEYMDSIIDNADIWLNTLDPDGRIVIWNKAAERLSGYSRADVQGRADIWEALYPNPGYRDYVFSRALEILNKGTVAMDLETTIRRKDGSETTLSWRSRLLTSSQGETVGSIAVARDVTLERKAEEVLRLHASVFETAHPMAITSPEGVLLRVNSAFCRLFGYPSQDVLNRTLRDLLPELTDEYAEAWEALRNHEQWHDEFEQRCQDGSQVPVQLTASCVRDERGRVTHYVLQWQDISERRAFEAQIRQQALYDALTGLPNRRLLLDRLERELSRAQRNGSFGALLFIDLDHFKQINDSYGHAVGDNLLINVANQMQSVLRTEDTSARLGGDEFVILLGAEETNRERATTQAERVAAKILEAIQTPIQSNNYQIAVSGSIGMALFPETGVDAEGLLQKADNAMYCAKEGGRNAVYFFSPELQAKVERNQQLSSDLRQAIPRNELALAYQPIVRADGMPIALEALVRWNSPVHGWCEPGDFLLAAEQAGLMRNLDQWVLRTACESWVNWQSRQLVPNDAVLSINVSPQFLLAQDFSERLQDTLSQSGMSPQRLTLDVAEQLLLHDLPGLHKAIDEAAALGIRFNLDNFGSGHSALQHLQHMPLASIKINGHLVAKGNGQLHNASILRAALSMTDSLNLQVVAKGVETALQFAALEQLGCNHFQGRYFSPPAASDELPALMTSLPQDA